MTADFNKPIAEDQFLDVLTQIRDNLDALAKQDLSDAQNVPEGAIQYSATNRRWEKRMGAVWTALSPLTQALDVRVRDSDRLGNKEPAYYRNANNINAGTLEVSRLDTETVDYDSANETKIARISAVRALYNWIRNQISTHAHTAQQITGIFALARIPNLPARKITSGVLAQSRIPDLPARKISSGVLDRARIPNLPANKIPGLPASRITSGVFEVGRIPDTIDARGLETVRVKTTTVGSQSTITGVALSASISNRELLLTLTITRPSPPRQATQATQAISSLGDHR